MIREREWNTSPLIITVAPTGAEVTRVDNPAVPYTPAEIAEETIAACSAGASVVHLHVREADGGPSAKTELFSDAIARIRTGCGAITMVSTGGAVGMSIDQRAAGLAGAPEMAGIEVGSLNYGEELFATKPSETRALARQASAEGIALEIEAFDVSHVEAACRFRDDGVLPNPLRFNLVVGVPGGLAASVRNLIALVSAVPTDAPWTATAIGKQQRRILATSMLLGATGVRVGFEDSVYIGKGKLARSNAELVAQARDLALTLGRTVAEPQQARELLGLETVPTAPAPAGQSVAYVLDGRHPGDA